MCDNVRGSTADPGNPGAWVSEIEGGVATATADSEPDADAGAREPAPARSSRREWMLVILGALALAAILTWPTLRDPGHTVPGDIGDPALFAWQIAWGGHALWNFPLHLWD